MPLIKDTSIGAVEKLKMEQKLKSERDRKELTDAQERIKKYFEDMKNNENMNEEEFKEYRREQYRQLKMDGKLDDNNALRVDSFIKTLMENIKQFKEYQGRYKFNFLSPVHFVNNKIFKKNLEAIEDKEYFEDDHNEKELMITSLFNKMFKDV